jgi:hypothetical protein
VESYHVFHPSVRLIPCSRLAAHRSQELTRWASLSQPRYPLDGSGLPDNSSLLWDSVKAAAAAVASRPPSTGANVSMFSSACYTLQTCTAGKALGLLSGGPRFLVFNTAHPHLPTTETVSKMLQCSASRAWTVWLSSAGFQPE